ncbi:MAG TPA: PC4/YdbC family ssDNA-binding protein [Tissierellaceae bacterium]|nr:PC4/YdbC family ssDNA-binding protein [Tissierellaceae bacterium]
MANIKYEITEKIAVLSERGDWTKEINRVSWNDRPAKFDLRDWNHETGKMGKGVTLTEEEARMLMEALEEVLKE